MRRLDSAALSPVYGAFGEVGDAAPCLRAFGLQAEFERRQCALVEVYQRAAISGEGVVVVWRDAKVCQGGRCVR